MIFREFEDSSYTGLCKNLVHKKGSEIQIDFLECLREKDIFLNWIKANVDFTSGEPLANLSEPLTENEYKESTAQNEQHIFEVWQYLTPRLACRMSLWGMITYQQIEKDIIQPSYLAGNGVVSGLTRIDKALTDDGDKEKDNVVRTALRRLSGLFERGNRTVYVDCPFARTWWRVYITKEVCDEPEINKEKVLKTLKISNTYWEELINTIVSRNSVLGDSRTRAALIWAIAEKREIDGYEKLNSPNTLKDIIRRIGIRSALQELAVFDVAELKTMIEDDFIKPLVNNHEIPEKTTS